MQPQSELKVPSQYHYTILNDRIDQLKEELQLTKQRMGNGVGGMAGGGGGVAMTVAEISAVSVAAHKVKRCSLTRLDSVCSQQLNLTYDEALSNVAFKLICATA